MQRAKRQYKSREMWIKHLEAASIFDGTDKEYCEKHDLNAKYFSVNKKKLGFPLSTPGTSRKSFSKVKVVDEVVPMAGKRSEIDPIWLARFLKEILNSK
jgi:hypothetical protein